MGNIVRKTETAENGIENSRAVYYEAAVNLIWATCTGVRRYARSCISENYRSSPVIVGQARPFLRQNARSKSDNTLHYRASPINNRNFEKLGIARPFHLRNDRAVQFLQFSTPVLRIT
ncbi:hypothetical protein Hanom_Chr17g01553281 [Helianthus anomalus]